MCEFRPAGTHRCPGLTRVEAPFMSVLTLAFAAAVFSVLSPGQFPVAIADGLPTPAWAFQVSTLPGWLQWSNAC